MTRSTHTPGPWAIGARDGYSQSRLTAKAGTVADLTLYAGANDKGEAMANARLIAAAPDMLAALERALKNAQFRQERAPIFEPKLGQSKADIQSEVDDLRDAIAKARGKAVQS